MENYAPLAIQATMLSQTAFCKFLAANDTGLTGGHQAGIYISKPSISILFDQPGERGEIKERWVEIKWQDDFTTHSRFIYYGQKTRNEYRITNFGRGFPFLRPEYTGALFILIQDDYEEYQAYILNTDEEINTYLDAFGMSPAETNSLIDKSRILSDYDEHQAVQTFISSLTKDFPSSEEMSKAAREIELQIFNHKELIQEDPDKKLLDWTDEEYRLFRELEFVRYGSLISNGFSSVEDFIKIANIVLNRRKSRAGKSLEHHLAALFDGNDIEYSSQAITEGHKKPDFIFPSGKAYHDSSFPVDKLVSLAAKTTCKDRWRQVLNEADRLRDKNKYLCTLQQGISLAQMNEMKEEKVILVVPQPYIKTFPAEKRDEIWTIHKFIDYIREIEGK